LLATKAYDCLEAAKALLPLSLDNLDELAG
jgi:hypothetical protein